MLIKSKLTLSACVMVGVVATIWIFQARHLRELDIKAPDPNISVWECTGAYCTGPGL